MYIRTGAWTTGVDRRSLMSPNRPAKRAAWAEDLSCLAHKCVPLPSYIINNDHDSGILPHSHIQSSGRRPRRREFAENFDPKIRGWMYGGSEDRSRASHIHIRILHSSGPFYHLHLNLRHELSRSGCNKIQNTSREEISNFFSREVLEFECP